MRPLFLLLAVLASAPPAARAAAVGARASSSIVDSGIGLDFGALDQDVFRSTMAADLVRLYAQAGVKWARVRPEWDSVEVKIADGPPPVYLRWHDAGTDAAIALLRANGLKIMLTLNGSQMAKVTTDAPRDDNGKMAPWLDWVEHMAQRYGSSVDAWEIWNEPNLTWAGPGGINAPAYASLASQSADKIRSIVPGAYLILGGTSLIDVAYTTTVVSGVGGKYNAVAYHPYRQYPEQAQDAFVAAGAAPPISRPIRPNTNYFANTGAANYEGEVALLRAQLSAKGFPNMDLWSGEGSFPSVNETNNLWPGTEARQAKSLARQYVLNASLGVRTTVWWRWLDTNSWFGNQQTAPGDAWQDDYRLGAAVNDKYGFNTFSPVYAQQTVSLPPFGANANIAASSNIDMTLGGSTISATAAGFGFQNSVTYSLPFPLPAGDYTLWLHMASTDAASFALAICPDINGSSFTAVDGVSYNYIANEGIPAIFQQRPMTAYFYTPCNIFSQASTGGMFYPAVYHIDSDLPAGAPIILHLAGANTKLDELRVVPFSRTFVKKPSFTAMQTLAVLFDDRVGLSPVSADFTQGTMSAPEWAAFRTARFATGGGVPVIAYWVGLAPDTPAPFVERTAGLSLGAAIPDAVLIDPIAGTYAPVGAGRSFALRVQDYPLILTSLSALSKTSSQLILAEETYNYPNPARGDVTYLRFYLNRPAETTLEIYNAAHAKIFSVTQNAPEGKTAFPWHVGGVANGVYFYKVSAGGQSIVKKIIILR